ncbi:MAG TPA: hypothetical protein PK191_09890 [Niabella sp.]|nr:hypothetical protein [Niabella sp.]HRB07755.1 hypothetical protein [Niabella sp.]HRB28390.1 hypothetical protein [Niabella sp.]HRB51645.1 hypothetical protein [Niabella sp.]HRB61693.1 hypothetical protein [Niabella sp.]
MFASCQQETVEFKADSLADYFPLQVGKSSTYRLDSTVFVKSGSVVEIHRYQVRHTVVKETVDNANRKTFIVQRFINNEFGTGVWQSDGTFMITPTDKSIEVVDNNLRVTVLQAPLKSDFEWKGNSKLSFAPYAQLFEMGAGNDMNKWNFIYTGFGNETYEGQQYLDVWTVEQNNETLNIPPTTGTQYGSKEVSIEKYAKGVGLVFKDFQLYEYQRGNADSGNTPYYIGFGITMWMISHN